MSLHPTRRGSFCAPGDHNCSGSLQEIARSYKLLHLPHRELTHGHHPEPPNPFPTVDVPDHAHYIIGSVILIVGITGILGNSLVIYVFCRTRSLRTPGNLFVVNLAVADLLMSLTQSPVFFVASLHRRWVLGEVACELYAFCGALFGICSMMTLTAIAADRCLAITQPLAFLGKASCWRAGRVLAGVWFYALGWSLPPFFGWSAYVPEGLQTSCSWDYMSFTPSVRAYTILLFSFVFFIPLGIIGGCYWAIFRAIRTAEEEMKEINCSVTHKTYERMQSEWKMAKVALIVILLFVVSWSPYSVVALTATAGYSHLLTPYMNSVPAVIAKASAIHNPIIYAITHPKYRAAIAHYLPALRSVLRVGEKEIRSSFSSCSGASSRRPTLTSQCSLGAAARANGRWGKARLSSASDTDSCWTESEADGSSVSSLPFSRRVSTEISTDTAIQPQQLGLSATLALKSGSSERPVSSPVAAASETDVEEGDGLFDGKTFLLSGN
ncbi:melanopsin-like [Denticeps clupeoides]|uniref:G-protein coupled receptors family 1 profile domain-containing protein n=1 Tax=Denticeps clupeoides TaxID=299321 RepID=A0AAY4AT65_9TELE|nr:melanopsin-like [Denticeps clupeoides]